MVSHSGVSLMENGLLVPQSAALNQGVGKQSARFIRHGPSMCRPNLHGTASLKLYRHGFDL